MVAIIDSRVSDKCEAALSRHGFFTVRLPASPGLSPALSSHPDMLMFLDGDTIITSIDYAERAEAELSLIGCMADVYKIRAVDEEQVASYPHDAIFNALRIGDRLFCKTDTAARAVLAYAEERGLEIVHTNQGYPACCALAISDSAVITADRGLYKSFTECGIDTCLINNGGILLPPYEYGFIGGAAGVYRDKVYFLGNLSAHPDCTVIRDFCQKHGKTAISLSDEPLIDLGKILFI